MGHMIETCLKLTESAFRLSLVRLSLSLDFSCYYRKEVLQDLSLVKHMSILCLLNALDCYLYITNKYIEFVTTQKTDTCHTNAYTNHMCICP